MCVRARSQKNRIYISKSNRIFFIGDEIKLVLPLDYFTDALSITSNRWIPGDDDCFYVINGKNTSILIPEYVRSSGKCFEELINSKNVIYKKITIGFIPYVFWRKAIGLIPNGTLRYAAYGRQEIDKLLSGGIINE